MAANKSEYLENAILDHFLRNTSTTSPVTVYAALYTVAPTKTTAGTEVTGGSYARQAAAFDAPAAGATQNTGPIAFPTATAPWGIVTSCAILDDDPGGNILYFGDLTAQKTVDTGDTVTFATGTLQVSET